MDQSSSSAQPSNSDAQRCVVRLHGGRDAKTSDIIANGHTKQQKPVANVSTMAQLIDIPTHSQCVTNDRKLDILDKNSTLEPESDEKRGVGLNLTSTLLATFLTSFQSGTSARSVSHIKRFSTCPGLTSKTSVGHRTTSSLKKWQNSQVSVPVWTTRMGTTSIERLKQR